MIASAAVRFYDVLVFFHVAAVVIGFGPTFAYALFQAVAARSGVTASLATSRAVVTWNMTGLTICMVIVFLSGMYLASYESYWQLSDFFISWGFLVMLILFALVHGFFVPREKRVISMLEEEAAKPGATESAELPATVAERYSQIGKVGVATGILIVLTIYVMVAKPFL